MFENLEVSSWIGMRAGCDMDYVINSEEDVDFLLSDGQRRFEFAMETEALRAFLDVGSKALAEKDVRAAQEKVEREAEEHSQLALTTERPS